MSLPRDSPSPHPRAGEVQGRQTVLSSFPLSLSNGEEGSPSFTYHLWGPLMFPFYLERSQTASRAESAKAGAMVPVTLSPRTPHFPACWSHLSPPFLHLPLRFPRGSCLRPTLAQGALWGSEPPSAPPCFLTGAWGPREGLGQCSDVRGWGATRGTASGRKLSQHLWAEQNAPAARPSWVSEVSELAQGHRASATAAGSKPEAIRGFGKLGIWPFVRCCGNSGWP